VDDVLVGTEEEKSHNKIVEEVLKRLEENDLYVKPEKYKVNSVPGPELSQLPSKSILTKRT